MVPHRNSEKGQAIVLLVIGFVVFLGFVALAIDGGMVYANRRQSQNSSDASSLAGGGTIALELENRFINIYTWDCSSGNIYTAMQLGRQASIGRAGANNYEIDENYEDDRNGVQTLCIQSDPSAGYDDKYIDVTVQISETTEASFAQILFPGALRNNVQAITRVRPPQPLAFGNAVVALNPAACGGQQNGAGFHGSGDLQVSGGGIWTNGCLRGDGGVDVYVDPPDGIHYVGAYNGGGDLDPEPSPVPHPLPPESYRIPPPNCNHPDAHNVTGNQLKNSSPLEPGLYCVTGELRLNAGDNLVGHDVTIYMVDDGIHINGHATTQLDAPDDPQATPEIPGILIFLAPGNNAPIEINGTSDSYFEGTVLAPESNVDVSGTGGMNAFRAQIIGWNVEMGGDADFDVVFDENRNHERPASIELFR